MKDFYEKLEAVRPKWCKHPPFVGLGYCWSLANAIEDGELDKIKNSCKKCELMEDEE